ncbi:5-oxoprolinase subunit PxpB [Fusibacter paucivorans]|uniref:5-oxoprolinase subunit PxpB n=1 Tax=Fusibacter paucivorans TaxID=76009 RepID=A0ABS5PKN3_9FIRM|nr:5-oxoprolinase subunit PxpB [Fusibacter paucivorans]MBS7525447.1 5-oxoprolinase subunit PxpB [Fusibacter paucivorans]
MMKKIEIMTESESMLLIRWQSVIDVSLNQQVHHTAQAIRTVFNESIRDVIPAYHSIAVIVDPLETSVSSLCDAVEAFLLTFDEVMIQHTIRKLYIPVCYEGDYAPDMDELSQYAQMMPDEVVKRHTAPDYPVYMIGFLPGFPYLGGLDEKLHMPRKERPRKAIAAGSVGIAGGQTGIYPLQSPGGWQLIGRTPIKLFDVAALSPSCIHAGDVVRFVAISEQDYDAIEKGKKRWDLYTL